MKDKIAAYYTALVSTMLGLLGLDARQDMVRANKAAYDRGQTNLVGLILGITVAAIVGIAVAVPVINDVIASANLSGTTAIVAGLLPLFVVLLVLVAIASPLMNRM